VVLAVRLSWPWNGVALTRSLTADRRPIDPPPIVQLRVIDKAPKNLPSPSPSPPPAQPSHPHAQPHTHESSGPLDTSMLTPAGFCAGPFLQNPYYFMFASLAKPDDDTELHWMKVRVLHLPSPSPLLVLTLPQDGKTRCTTGSVVSSLYHLKDSENENRDAGFFVFPDLSVRQEGSYRLKLSLFEVVGCVPTSFLSSSHAPLLPAPLSLMNPLHIHHKTISFATKRPLSLSKFVPVRSVLYGTPSVSLRRVFLIPFLK